METHRPDSLGLDTTVTTSRSGCKHHCNGHPVVTVLYCELVSRPERPMEPESCPISRLKN